MIRKDNPLPSRNLGLELARVTEAAAIAAARFMGMGNKERGDMAAAEAMRAFLKTVDMNGVVVIGEGDVEDTPALFNGEHIGNGEGPELDVAVGPVEGAALLADGRPNAISAMAVAERGSMWNPGNSFYMNKIVVGRDAKEAIDIRLSPTQNLHRIAEALGKKVNELTIFVLDKNRHASLVEEIRQAGARISLHSEGDVMGALMAAVPGTCIDALMGIGGSTKGVMAAAAVKALGGGMEGMRAPQREDEKRQLRKDGVKVREVLQLDTLIRSDNIFFAATGITPSTFLKGVNFNSERSLTTHSIVIRSVTRTIRFIRGIHQLENQPRARDKDSTTPVDAAFEIVK
ncbi:MAG: class II fructose-bisphosphatase [Lewinellaceae bacterium]|nr:class II fructose-bisphosphatase [Lewinellaceae bacterium]MCB9287605.1 class II fructose-bisphosphatase [Lewinellaceae bacterium]